MIQILLLPFSTQETEQGSIHQDTADQEGDGGSTDAAHEGAEGKRNQREARQTV